MHRNSSIEKSNHLNATSEKKSNTEQQNEKNVSIDQTQFKRPNKLKCRRQKFFAKKKTRNAINWSAHKINGDDDDERKKSDCDFHTKEKSSLLEWTESIERNEYKNASTE